MTFCKSEESHPEGPMVLPMRLLPSLVNGPSASELVEAVLRATMVLRRVPVPPSLRIPPPLAVVLVPLAVTLFLLTVELVSFPEVPPARMPPPAVCGLLSMPLLTRYFFGE